MVCPRPAPASRSLPEALGACGEGPGALIAHPLLRGARPCGAGIWGSPWLIGQVASPGGRDAWLARGPSERAEEIPLTPPAWFPAILDVVPGLFSPSGLRRVGRKSLGFLFGSLPASGLTWAVPICQTEAASTCVGDRPAWGPGGQPGAPCVDVGAGGLKSVCRPRRGVSAEPLGLQEGKLCSPF